MSDDFLHPVGGTWLAKCYGIDLVMPMRVMSRIGGRRATQIADGARIEVHVESMRPAATLRGHLTFHLKHEVPHLELLSRVFECCDTAVLSAWVDDEPTGQYARRVGFLYEFLTGRELPIGAPIGGTYVDAIDDQKLVAATRGRAVPNQRWRVRDNLPGTRGFCPVVHKTDAISQSMDLDVPGLIHALAGEFGEELLMKSAVWMTLRESKSSFEIEGEADKTDRVQRFADVLARRTGQGAWPLDQAALADLQAEILGRRTTVQQFGIRQSPVFVGEVVRYQEVVHYVAPPPEHLLAMLEGLRTFLDRTHGQSPVMRAAVAAFGFVYIHPLADGNGRLHRFLINDVLRRDHAVPDPMILPVSSLIASDAAERRAYDRILDAVSRPLMRVLAGQFEFAQVPTVYPDGISSNFVFHGNGIAVHAWRHLDLTPHVKYLAEVVDRTVREDMADESRYLRSHAQARAAIKDIIEMPDVQIDRVIRSVEASQGQLSNVLSREMPALREEGVWDDIVQAVKGAFQDGPRGAAAGKYIADSP